MAEQYVIFLTKLDFFLSNPTACTWIEFFQTTGILLGVAWAARTSYFAFRGRSVSEKAAPTPNSNDELADALKLGVAFSSVRRRIAELARARDIGNWRLRVYPGPGALLCNVGFFRPRILVSRDFIRMLDTKELAAGLAHELTHVLRRDNLKRALLEVVCFLAPLTIWLADSPQLSISSRQDFLAELGLGLATGLAIRMLVVPAVRYWQERRADEWAAIAIGDRLIVASALVKAASAGSTRPPRLVPHPVTNFAFYSTPVSGRVRRLVESGGRSLVRIDRWGQKGFRLAVAGLMLVATVAVYRAESTGLSGSVQISNCHVTLSVSR